MRLTQRLGAAPRFTNGAGTVTRVLITGMSGAGKSTLLSLLAARGVPTVDTDLDGWTLADGRWDEPRMSDLLAAHPRIVVSGTVENQGRFAFDHVVLLTAPLDVLLARVAVRDTNPYGHSASDRAEIARYAADVEPLLRRAADVVLDARRAPDELADAVAALLCD